MKYIFTIDGKLPGLNEFISSMNRNRYIGNKMKQQAQNMISLYIARDLKKIHIDLPVRIHYRFYEPNHKRDLDNVSGFAHKVIQDSLVNMKVLHNDSWNYIKGYSDSFYIDSQIGRAHV